MKMVIVDIPPDLKIKVAVLGAAGPECLSITKDLEDGLGTVTSRELTADYNLLSQQQVDENVQKRRQ